MPSRRAYLALVEGAALGVLGRQPTSEQTSNSDAHPGQFSRIPGDLGGNLYGATNGAPVGDIELSWRRSFDAGLVPLVGPSNNLYLLFDNGRILSLDTGGDTYEMSLINRMPNEIEDGLIQGTILFVADTENTMAAFDTLSSDRLWQRTHTTAIGDPVYANGDIYFPTDVPSLLRVNPDTGQELEEITLTDSDNDSSGGIFGSGSVSDPIMIATEPGTRDVPPVVYGTLPMTDGSVFAYRTDSNSIEWTTSIDSVQSRLVVVTDLLFTTSEAGVHCLNTQTGQQRWHYSRELSSPQVAAVNSGSVIVWTDNRLLALDPSNGDLRWESGLSPPGVNAVLASDSMVYVVIRSNELSIVGLDAMSGLEQWRRQFCQGNQWKRPALTNQFLLVPAEQTLYAFADDMDQRPTPTSSPTPTGNESEQQS